MNGTTASTGATVTVNDTYPAGDQWNLVAVEVLPASATTVSTVRYSGGSAASYVHTSLPAIVGPASCGSPVPVDDPLPDASHHLGWFFEGGEAVLRVEPVSVAGREQEAL